MRPKLTDIALKKVDAFRRKRVIEGLSIFDLFAAYDDVQRSALAQPDQIFLDIERCEIDHADRRHQQNLDSYGHLSPHRPRRRFRCRRAWRINSSGSFSNARMFRWSSKDRNRVRLVSVSPRRPGARRLMMPIWSK